MVSLTPGKKPSIQSFVAIEDVDGIWGESAATRKPSAGFAVIHDDPYFSIVLDDEGCFTGQLIGRPGMRLSNKVAIAASYGLLIEDIAYGANDCHTIFLREMTPEEKSALMPREVA